MYTCRPVRPELDSVSRVKEEDADGCSSVKLVDLDCWEGDKNGKLSAGNSLNVTLLLSIILSLAFLPSFLLTNTYSQCRKSCSTATVTASTTTKLLWNPPRKPGSSGPLGPPTAPGSFAVWCFPKKKKARLFL